MLQDQMMEELLKNPKIQAMASLKETFWRNPGKKPFAEAIKGGELTIEDVEDASRRLARFAPYIKAVFPETKAMGGILESPLREIPLMQSRLSQRGGGPMEGRWFLKCDSHLPVSGSIKARGGIYEVLCFAEEIALKEGGLDLKEDYSVLAEERYRKLFSRYRVAVGSTGNLGLSIGIMSAKLGFSVTVHMSADARKWKKNLLRSKGVQVVEYEDDYSLAVKEGRRQADGDPCCHFVDDENSKTLFLGYAVAALRLKKQLDGEQVTVDGAHPLFVYLPCGVGGGPGGVAFGLKLVFQDAVHCFFAEPTHSPCMMLGMATGLHSRISVQDIGIDNRTAADGLAVGRASGFVGRFMEPFIDGCYSVSDENMFRMLALLGETQDLWLEPSALAGMCGPLWLQQDCAGEYLESQGLVPYMAHAVHIPWGTGGSMVPEEDMEAYRETGRRLLCCTGRKSMVE